MMEKIKLEHPKYSNLYLIKSTYSKDNAQQLFEVVESFKDQIEHLWVGTWLTDFDLKSVQEHLKKVELLEEKDYFIVLNDKIIGKISNNTRDNLQYFVGYYLHKNYWGNNIMSLGLKKLIEVDSKVKYIKIHEKNIGSIHVALKNNFKFVSNSNQFNYYILEK